MGNLLRKVGFALLVLVLTAIIFYLVVDDRSVKDNIIENSLGLLGERLLKMVPDGPQKNLVQARYAHFLQQVTNREIEPKKVEYVAATILNISNHDSILTPEAASALFSIEISDQTPRTDTIQILIAPPPDHAVPPPTAAPEDWDHLGLRIQRLCELDEDLHKEFRQNAELKREFRRQVQFLTRDGLKLVMDAKMQERLRHAEVKRLQRNLHQLEREKMIVWRENFAAEQERFRIELGKLPPVPELDGLVERVQAVTDSLQTFELPDPAEFPEEMDSVRIVVRQIR